MTHIKSFVKKEGFEDTNGEYKIDDIDHPDGWDWKEVDMLIGMGFEPDGDTRFKLKVERNSDMVPLNFTVYKTDKGYWLVINDRKHVYKTFTEMLNMIDTFGSVETP